MQNFRSLWVGALLILAVPTVLSLFEFGATTPHTERNHRPHLEIAPGFSTSDPETIGSQVTQSSPHASGPSIPAQDPEVKPPPFLHATNTDSLDEATSAQIRTELANAVERAQEDRDFSIDLEIIEQLAVREQVAIIVGSQTGLPEFQHRLSGTRHASGHRYRYIPYAALEAGPQALLELIETQEINQIEMDEQHHPTLAESVPLVYASQDTENGFDGSGYAIAILDTGVDTSHPAFQDRVTDEACFSRQGDCPGGTEQEFGPGTGIPCDFQCDHGTIVAGIALGMDEEETHHGIARGAGLISIQVFSEADGKPAAWTSDILAALEHVYDLSLFHKIAAVSMSLGGETYASQEICDQANSSRKAIIDQLRSAGIPTIVSSGNDGDEEEISSPACISSAISVGATSISDGIPSYSNSAEFLSLLAPGHRIRTRTANGGYTVASGTSMAAPHVSGAIAIIQEAAPQSSLEEILFALQFTGVPITDSRNDLTFPRIDVDGAIEFLAEPLPQDEEEEEDVVAEEEEEQEPTSKEASPPPPSGGSSSSCGLVGLEILLPLALTSGLRRAQRRKSVSRTA